MCFNPTASLIAFAIGFVSWVVLLSMKMYSDALIAMYLFAMQLLEYFAHKSVINRDKVMNVITAKLIYLFIFVQPLLFYAASTMLKQKYWVKDANRFLFLIPVYIIFCGFFYRYLNQRNLFQTTYLDDSCKNICRMSWDFFAYNKGLTTIALLLYLLICTAFFKKTLIPLYAIVLFVVSLIYTIFLSRDLKTAFSIFGSIWCFLAITYGPATIYKTLYP